MPHLVSHHRLDFLSRSAFQQVVIHCDAHGAAESADVRAHARGLFRCVNLVDIMRGNAVSPRHTKDRCSHFGIVEYCDFVEDGKDEDRGDQRHERREHGHYGRAPYPPGARSFSSQAE